MPGAVRRRGHGDGLRLVLSNLTENSFVEGVTKDETNINCQKFPHYADKMKETQSPAPLQHMFMVYIQVHGYPHACTCSMY